MLAINAATLDKIAARCRYDLYYLARNILGYDLMQPHVHADLCKYAESLLLPHPVEWFPPEAKKGSGIEDQYDPNNTNDLILMPRGTFKSSVVTIGLPLQAFLNNPNVRVLLDSETFSKSKAFLSEVKGHLTTNAKYRQVFHRIHGVYPDEGKKKDMLWTDSQLNLACRSRPLKEPSISCAGIDVTKNGMHYDLIICDDLHSEKNVTNKEQIDQVVNHWKLAYSLLDPGKPMVVIGTRWDDNDLYQHILDNERDTFNIIVRKAIGDNGELLFPEWLTQAFLDDVKKKQGSRIFSAQYMNMPVDDENATFKQEYFSRIEWDLVKDRPINWYLSVDPSYEGEYSDYAALVVAGMDYMGDLYVRHIVRKKMRYKDLIDSIFEIYNSSTLFSRGVKIKRIAVETIAQAKSIEISMNEEQKTRGQWLPVVYIKGQRKSKEERIRGLAPFYENRRVYHIRGMIHVTELEYELLHFPRAKNDDVVDALATVPEIATRPNARSYESDGSHRPHRSSYKPRSPITNV